MNISQICILFSILEVLFLIENLTFHLEHSVSSLYTAILMMHLNIVQVRKQLCVHSHCVFIYWSKGVFVEASGHEKHLPPLLYCMAQHASLVQVLTNTFLLYSSQFSILSDRRDTTTSLQKIQHHAGKVEIDCVRLFHQNQCVRLLRDAFDLYENLSTLCKFRS